MKTDIESLKQLMDIKEFDSLRGKALAHISAKQFRVYQDCISWQQKSPTFGLEQEQIDNSITSIDCRYANGKWTKMITSYGNGKQVTEYNDKRKKDKVEWH